MSATLPQELVDRIGALIREIESVEQARVPVEQEVAAEMTRLDQIAAKAEASSSLWLAAHPNFSVAAFNDALTGALLQIEPDKTRKMIADRARRRAEAWRGLRRRSA